jgi:hypothetical protein
MPPTKKLPWTLALAIVGAVLAAGCGGGHHHDDVVVEDVFIPVGDVEIDNQTDLSGTFENLFFFDMAPAGTALWTGNLLPFDVLPGEVLYVDSFDEDFYDAEAEADLGIVSFFDIFVEGGYTTTFEVF